MTATYFAILTNVGAAKLANAQALGSTLKITQMAVGDGGGSVPTPTATRTALIGEQRRAPLNQLSVDKANSSQIIAEQVLPETVGGWWIRELGLFDSAGDLIAYANCPPSYKPQLAEGSGRTQTIRMVLIVSNVATLELKIDPAVVLATREFVATSAEEALARLDVKNSVRVATTNALAVLSGMQSIDGVALAKGDRILVKNQPVTADNGIYIASDGAWSRSLDGISVLALNTGAQVSVESGKANSDTTWRLLSSNLWVPISGITASVTRSADVSLSAASPLKHTWTTVQRDRQSLFDVANNLFVAKWPGIYEVCAAIHLDASGNTNSSFLHALVNGSLTSVQSRTGTGGGFSNLTAFVVSAKIYMQVGDSVGIYSYLTGSAKQISFGDDDHNFFSISYQGEL